MSAIFTNTYAPFGGRNTVNTFDNIYPTQRFSSRMHATPVKVNIFDAIDCFGTAQGADIIACTPKNPSMGLRSFDDLDLHLLRANAGRFNINNAGYTNNEFRRSFDDIDLLPLQNQHARSAFDGGMTTGGISIRVIPDESVRHAVWAAATGMNRPPMTICDDCVEDFAPLVSHFQSQLTGDTNSINNFNNIGNGYSPVVRDTQHARIHRQAHYMQDLAQRTVQHPIAQTVDSHHPRNLREVQLLHSYRRMCGTLIAYDDLDAIHPRDINELMVIRKDRRSRGELTMGEMMMDPMDEMMILEAHHRAHQRGDASLCVEDIEELCVMRCKRQCRGACFYTELCRCIEECMCETDCGGELDCIDMPTRRFARGGMNLPFRSGRGQMFGGYMSRMMQMQPRLADVNNAMLPTRFSRW
ncbi:hypothetical protein HK097_002978 [Rhizophlyctis rosea]|uniref:Uncharacterized protein n=1 Tax=Rhizophlyctis rosea TaxID=64517 RepID=A0AAD5SGL3_9FUNG|nr:hypothetical protein HK097_002978 [Rhizophlyctis rosea]